MHNFVGRKKWISRFNDYMHSDEGLIWRITGVPGIGKSTLMKRFAGRCEEAGRFHVWLDLEGYQAGHGLDILTELSKSTRFFDTEESNKTIREKLGERFIQYKDDLGSVLEAGTLVDPSGGLITGGAKVLLDLGNGLAGSAANMSEEAAAVHPELFLVKALAAAGEKNPICLVDTFEHILTGDLNVQSRLDFNFDEPRETTLKTQPVAGWLNQLFEFLRSNGWRIVIAGRNMHEAKVKDKLNRFSREEIREAANNRPNLGPYMPDQADEIIDVLAILSFEGNPLWLQVAMNLLENLLEDGEDLTQLAAKPEYLHQCFEEEDASNLSGHYGIEHASCKLQLIRTLTQHIDGIEDQAWKVALPRVLSPDILSQLFERQQANAIRHNFTIAGVFRGNPRKQFTLHEEIRDLLLAYARNKKYIEQDNTSALHDQLWKHLNKRYSADEQYPVIWQLEACYHRLNSVQSLLKASNLPHPNDFVTLLLGSGSLSVNEKWRIAQAAEDITEFQFLELNRILGEERSKWEDLFGVEIARKLLIDLSEGKVQNITDISYWQRQLEKDPSAGNYHALIQVVKEEEEYTEYQLQLTGELLERYGESDLPAVQEQCAMALVNKAITQGNQLDDPQGSIATYDDVLERYGESDLPAVQEQCAKALVNKAITQGNQLDDPQGEIATYDDVLERYGESDLPAVQEQL